MATNRSDTKATAASLMQLATAFRASRAIYVAAALGIPDLLANGSMSSDELGAATKTHIPSIRRLMRTLSALGVFEECEPGRFQLTPKGTCLRRDIPGSVRAGVLFFAGDTGWRVWQPALQHSNGQSCV